jgi:DNA polymerase I
MRHILFGADASKLTVALLIKDSSFNKAHILTQYVNPLVEAGISKDSIVAFTLKYGASKKVKAAYQKEYLDVLLPAIDELGIKVLYCTDTEYFKTLTKNRTAEPFHGCVVPCALNVSMDVVLGINYQAIFYNPLLKPKLEVSLKTLSDCLLNTHIEPGNNIIHLGLFPDSIDDIKASLMNLHQYPMLTCDTETFGLNFYNCGLGTISFAWDEHHGIAFAVDCGPEGNRAVVRDLIKEFLTSYKGTLIYHRASFDLKVLVYQLWMKDLGDYVGMLDGIEILTRKFEDTLLIAYLATNNTVKNILGLKVLAQEFAGNWAQEEIKDITLIPLDQLLEYNLKDCLATWFVFNKYYPQMVEDDQLHFYLNQMKPAVKLILQIELTGMPIDPVKVQEARAILEKIVGEHHAYLENSPILKDFHNQQLEERVVYDNTKLKKKVRVLSDFADVKFNPGSDQQLQGLIYDYLGYEVIDTTDGGKPATGSKTLEKLINHAKTDVHKEILEHLIGLAKADKILTSFIPAFEQAQQLPDGSYRLYGSFNQGTVQSGRLSSSDPNMQNIPANSAYAKIVKACFISLHDWLFCGADFKALEAVVGALLPMDPAKLQVYVNGFDSHCVNTYAYFPEKLSDIREASPTESAFKIIQDGVTYYMKECDKIITPKGKITTIKDYYESTN